MNKIGEPCTDAEVSAQTTPAQIAASLTVADVVAWLNERALSYGIPGLCFKIDAGEPPCIARCRSDGQAFGCGDTFDAAVKMIRKEIRSNEERASAKRAEAARLLAEADALTNQGAKGVAA